MQRYSTYLLLATGIGDSIGVCALIRRPWFLNGLGKAKNKTERESGRYLKIKTNQHKKGARIFRFGEKSISQAHR